MTNILTLEDIIFLNSDNDKEENRMHGKYFANYTLDTNCVSKRTIMFSPNGDVAVLCWHHFIHLQIQELWFHTET